MDEKLTPLERVTIECWMHERLNINDCKAPPGYTGEVPNPVKITEDLLRRFCRLQIEDKRRMQLHLKNAAQFAKDEGDKDVAESFLNASCSGTVKLTH